MGRARCPSCRRTWAGPDLGCTCSRGASGGVTGPSPRAFVGRPGRASPVVGHATGGTSRLQLASASGCALVGSAGSSAILGSRSFSGRSAIRGSGARGSRVPRLGRRRGPCGIRATADRSAGVGRPGLAVHVEAADPFLGHSQDRGTCRAPCAIVVSACARRAGRSPRAVSSSGMGSAQRLGRSGSGSTFSAC
jgi:hypothetical protein